MARASHIEGGSFSKCGSRLSAAHILLGMALWHDSVSSRRNSQADPWRRNPENNVLACFRDFKRVSSNEAGTVLGELGERVYSNIVDGSWVYSGPAPPPHPAAFRFVSPPPPPPPPPPAPAPVPAPPPPPEILASHLFRSGH
eukprot:9473102-Pyramimonas_sp.AAC.1